MDRKYDIVFFSVLEECSKSRIRTIYHGGRENLIDEMHKRLQSKASIKMMCSIDPIFGNIKHNLGYRDFLLRHIEKTNGEFKLMCIGHNLKKILSFFLNKVKQREEKDRNFALVYV